MSNIVINDEEKDVYFNTDESCNSLLLLTMLTVSEINALYVCFLQDTRMNSNILFSYTLYSSLYQIICLHILGHDCLSRKFVITFILLLAFINTMVKLLCLHVLYKNPLKSYTINCLLNTLMQENTVPIFPFVMPHKW